MERLAGETYTPVVGEATYTGSGESPYASDLEAHYACAGGDAAYTECSRVNIHKISIK
jgi:hypothetical protein